MIKKFYNLLFLLILSHFSLGTIFAFSPEAFDKEKFQVAQKAGKVVLVDVYAKWCPTCKVQHADLEKFLSEPKYKNVLVFRVDFDDKPLVKSFGELIGKPIPRQSTIVIFKGTQQVAFSVAEQGSQLKAQIDRAF